MARVGFLEQFNHRRVAGWSSGWEDNSFVRILFNGQDEFTAPLRQKRADLPEGTGEFTLQLPHHLQETHPLSVSCYSPNGCELDNSPQQIETRSSELRKVLIGKDNWRFLCNDTNENLDYLIGRKQINLSVVERWCALIRSRKAICSMKGAAFVQCIISEKPVVYSDKLPEGYSLSAARPATLILEALGGAANEYLVYGPTREELSGATKDLFYRGDTH